MTILHSSATNKPVKTPYSDYLRSGIGRCALIFLLVMFLSSSPASAAWWNASWGSKAPILINNTGNATILTNFSVNLNVTYNSNMNAAFSDLRMVNEPSGTLIPYWIESKVNSSYANVWFNASSIAASSWTNSTYYLYYGNTVATSQSNGTATFTAWHGAATSNFNDAFLVQQPFVYEASVQRTSGGGTDEILWGVADNSDPRSAANNAVFNLLYGTNNQRYLQSTQNTTPSSNVDTPTYTQNQNYRIKITVPNSSSATLHTDGYSGDLTATPNIPLVKMGLVMQVSIGTGSQDWSFARKYAIVQPTSQLGTETGVLITGWSNNYTSSPSLAFLIPTTTNILFNVSTIGGGYSADYYSWYLNGINQSRNANNISLYIYSNADNNITATAYNSTSGKSSSITWIVTLPFTLLTPVNNATLTKAFPPLTSNIYFSWGAIGYPYYNLMIAKDITFNLPVSDLFSTTTYQTIPLPAGSYYWKVQYYDPTTLTYGDWSPTFNFTLTNNVSALGTAIQGVVYKLVNGVPTPISGANVYIYNNQSTYTNMMTTGSNGYYLFTGLTNSTTYVIRATKTDEYDDSAIYYVTTGLGTTATQNILMQTCTVNYNCYVNIIKMRFGLRYLNGSAIPDVLATVYKSGELIATDAGTTGSDGNVVFSLLRTQKYHVVFTLNSVQIGTWDGYPSDAINIEISSGVTVTPITPPANMTNFTDTPGTYGWGIATFTSTNLTSQYGLGAKAQGILVAVFALWLIPVGGVAATAVAFSGLAVLGVISAKFVILIIISMLAWFIVKKEFT